MLFEAKQFNSINGVQGLSERQMKEHYKLYEGYVKKANEITKALKSVDHSKANATYSDLRALKMGYSFAVNAIKSHELFFENISGNGTVQNGFVAQQLQKQFGSIEQWQLDMQATGMAARGWVWLAFVWENGSRFNYLGDAHDAFPVWHATPLIALDVYEHAYFIDYGTTRADYLTAFFKNIHWESVEALAVTLGMDKVQV